LLSLHVQKVALAIPVPINKERGVAISNYLDEHLVLFLDVDHRDRALQVLIDKLESEGKLHDKQTFHQAILERERIISTGIGMGVAIPHAKLEGYSDFFIAIGIQHKRGIEWNALDGLPVRMIFLIGGPENKQTEYLKILSSLTVAIKDEDRRKKILKAKTAREVIDLFRGL
jgi:nitrogen PTS system EIIA component